MHESVWFSNRNITGADDATLKRRYRDSYIFRLKFIQAFSVFKSAPRIKNATEHVSCCPSGQIWPWAVQHMSVAAHERGPESKKRKQMVTLCKLAVSGDDPSSHYERNILG